MPVVRRAQVHELPAVRAVIATAFEQDPMLVWVFPDAATRLESTAAWLGMFVEAFVLADRADVLEHDGEIVAASLWHPATEERPGFGTVPTVVGLLRSIIGDARTEQALVGFGALGAAHPDHPHAYLQLLGVVPALQGRGLGRLVLRPCLDAADAAGEPLYLETMSTRNVSFYRSLGFDVLAELELGSDGPATWAMERPPAAAG